MNVRPRIGLLPFYLSLYDKSAPGRRDEFAPFIAAIVDGFSRNGVDADIAPICCVEPEFADAIRQFEAGGVDIIVAVHLAYSPSMEAAGPLVRTRLPLLLLDTTMDYDFGRGVDPDRISYDHGIHGVQDLASVLRREKRPYEIVAGHVTESDTLQRAAQIARAACAARKLRGMRVLRVGESFHGMGDFAVSAETLRDAFDIAVETVDLDALSREAAGVSESEVDEEREHDRREFDLDVDEPTHRRSLRVSLALRRIIDRGAYGAFSMNFLAFNSRDVAADTVPFLEASKGMARGLGYAGEGDVLTACLMGALNAAFGDCTFTEIFCPDWKGNSLFLSHMGEINPRIAAQRPLLVELDFPYADCRNPAVLAAAYRPGPATLVNIAPGPDDTFSLIASELEVLGDATYPGMKRCIRAWVKPAMALPAFLEAYSRNGGTHHSALVYGHCTESIRAFARFTGLPLTIIGARNGD